MRKTMRLIACANTAILSSTAILLSGCSWLGIGGGGQSYSAQSVRYQGGSAQYNTQNGSRQLGRQLGRCEITSPNQRIPDGCHPEDVTLAIGGSGYTPQGQYTNGAYGSHVQNAQSVQGAQSNYAPRPRVKRPWLRGQIGLEIDHSVSGNLYDPGQTGAAAAYNRALYEEGTISGSPATGQTISTRYYSALERVEAPEISFDDVYTAPLRITGGLEVIFSDHATVFANAGYTRAEGKKGGGVQIVDTLLRDVTTQDFDAGTGLPLGGPVGPVTTFIPNEVVATFDYEFNEMERIDLEAGARYYFNPVLKNQLQRPLTPFVSASGGAAYYSETTVSENQRQRFLGRAFDGTQVNASGDFYDVNFGSSTQIYDSQWVPYGALKGGLEWQMTPKTALAFEAGVKYEGARDFSSGVKGDDIISIPVTIRGSYNF